MARAQAFDTNMGIARYYSGDRPMEFVNKALADGLAAVVVQETAMSNAHIFRADGTSNEFTGHVPGMWDGRNGYVS